MKKGFTAIASMAAAALLLTACGGGSDAPTDVATDGATDAATDAATDTATGDSYSVGILQLVDHASLDQANQGFVQAFEDAGIDVQGESIKLFHPRQVRYGLASGAPGAQGGVAMVLFRR